MITARSVFRECALLFGLVGIAPLTVGDGVVVAAGDTGPEAGSLAEVTTYYASAWGAYKASGLVWTSDRDGRIGTGNSFSTTTLSVGTHRITLTATDAQGNTGTATRTITITPSGGGNQPPVAAFTYLCNTTPHQCAFNAGTSTDDHGLASYAWSWGNGRSETKTMPTTRNTWATAPGAFVVTLTVTDAGGLTASITKSVTVP